MGQAAALPTEFSIGFSSKYAGGHEPQAPDASSRTPSTTASKRMVFGGSAAAMACSSSDLRMPRASWGPPSHSFSKSKLRSSCPPRVHSSVLRAPSLLVGHVNYYTCPTTTWRSTGRSAPEGAGGAAGSAPTASLPGDEPNAGSCAHTFGDLLKLATCSVSGSAASKRSPVPRSARGQSACSGRKVHMPTCGRRCGAPLQQRVFGAQGRSHADGVQRTESVRPHGDRTAPPGYLAASLQHHHRDPHLQPALHTLLGLMVAPTYNSMVP